MTAEWSCDGSPPWVGRIRARLERWREAGLGPRWVVAVSGGSDSVGLLRLLHAVGPRLGLGLSVAHLDHGARGEASAADARFVAQLAGSLGLPFDVGQWQPTRPGHFEADARRARYGWLAEVAAARGASAVAVGHTRDDQAETILHRILRGTGPRGLAGMPARRSLSDSVTLLRPLLRVSRRDVQDYLAAIGQEYRDDASNADLSRTRARIRHDLLPKLADEYNPAVAEALVRLGQLAGATQRALHRRLAELMRVATVSASPDAVVLRLDGLRPLPTLMLTEVLRLAWRRQGWPEAGMGAKRWGRLARLVKAGRGRLSVGGGMDAEASGDVIRLASAQRAAGPARGRPAAAPLDVPGSVDWVVGRVVATLDPDSPRDETLDLDCVVPPLWVGPPEPGDRFEPLGMGGQKMPLNDFLRGRRIPRPERASIPVVRDASGIVWVVGHRIAHRVRRTEATQRTLGLRWEPAYPTDGCD